MYYLLNDSLKEWMIVLTMNARVRLHIFYLNQGYSHVKMFPESHYSMMVSGICPTNIQ